MELSRKNKDNSIKAMNSHKLGSHGYTSKIDAFERELEEVEHLGVEPKTANWEPRSILYCMGRNVRHAEDGSFSSSNQPMSELIQRISQVTKEVR